MINPLKGIYLENKYYGYVDTSYTETVGIKNSVIEAQNNRTTSIFGLQDEDFTITLSLDNSYEVLAGSSVVGTTTWLGLSRLVDLKNFIGGLGPSMPIIFVNPYGASFSVIPTGQLSITAFNPENPAEASMEFRVSLTLQRV